jgi:hypothetical protein
MRIRLRTLLIVAALGPAILAAAVLGLERPYAEFRRRLDRWIGERTSQHPVGQPGVPGQQKDETSEDR